MKRTILTLLLYSVVAISCSKQVQAQVEKAEPILQAEKEPKDTRMDTIKKALTILPNNIAAECLSKIENNPEQFFSLLLAAQKESDDNGDLLILVDKKNYLPNPYEPSDLVSLNNYNLSVSRKDLRLRECIMSSVLEMNKAAIADGVTLHFSSSYRSYEYQDGLFNRYAARDGVAEAERYSARPGTSQHQLGTAIDFGTIDDSYAKTKAGKWLAQNASRFGFTLSFPEGMEDVTGYIWECWHFRYITKPGAILQQEYFNNIQQYFIEFVDAYKKIN